MKRTYLAGLVLGVATLCAVCADASAQAEDGTEEGAPVEKKEEGPSTLKTLGSIGLAITGLVIVLIPAVKTFSSSLSYQAARLMLTNFLRTNPYQAEIMAKRMEGTFAEGIAAALKMGGMVGSQDLKTIQSATAPTYDGAAMGVMAKWKGDTAKAKMGIMAAVAGAAIGLSGGSYAAIPVIIAVLTIAAFLRLMLYMRDLEGNIIRARAEILPEVDATVAAGRYRVAPP
ncbi:MAG: hypothetical protein H0T46_20685 [Deltaproteobacteria bacterium]|nr:hypothetical protein [Deltaproteobacteria bacterium]